MKQPAKSRDMHSVPAKRKKTQQQTRVADFSAAWMMRDPEIAQEELPEFSANVFEQKTGGLLGTLERQVGAIEQKIQELGNDLKAERKSLKDIPPMITVFNPDVHGDKKGFWKYGVKNTILAFVNGSALVVCLSASWTNVYSNLIASSPVYAENLILAGILALLAPSGALALKSISSFFETDKSKKRYSSLIYALTAASLLAWVSLFSITFNGASGEINLESLLDESSGSTGAWLVWATLVSEVLIGSSLALSLEQIYQQYRPNRREDNPDYVLIKKRIAELDKALDAENKKLNEIQPRRDTLRAEKAAYITEEMVAFTALRNRFDALNNFTL